MHDLQYKGPPHKNTNNYHPERRCGAHTKLSVACRRSRRLGGRRQCRFRAWRETPWVPSVHHSCDCTLRIGFSRSSPTRVVPRAQTARPRIRTILVEESQTACAMRDSLKTNAHTKIRCMGIMTATTATTGTVRPLVIDVKSAQAEWLPVNFVVLCRNNNNTFY